MIRNRFAAYALMMITFLYAFPDQDMTRFDALAIITVSYIAYLMLTVWAEEKLRNKKRPVASKHYHHPGSGPDRI